MKWNNLTLPFSTLFNFCVIVQVTVSQICLFIITINFLLIYVHTYQYLCYIIVKFWQIFFLLGSRSLKSHHGHLQSLGRPWMHANKTGERKLLQQLHSFCMQTQQKNLCLQTQNYTFAFIRCFYPKRLTESHWVYIYIYIQSIHFFVCVFPGNWTHNLLRW